MSSEGKEEEERKARGLYEVLVLTASTYSHYIRMDNEDARKIREYAEKIGKELLNEVLPFLQGASNYEDYVARVEAVVLTSIGVLSTLANYCEYDVNEIMGSLATLFAIATKEKGKHPVKVMAEEMSRIGKLIEEIKKKKEEENREGREVV